LLYFSSDRPGGLFSLGGLRDIEPTDSNFSSLGMRMGGFFSIA
jgi:hypothetical protein